MKVFISWSGNQSYSLAECLADGLPNVIQRAKPFISTGISKGARWSTIIASELDYTEFGILCVTADNIDAPWLLFEAGAISKSLAHGKVAPILIGIGKDALSGSPLAQFQLTELGRDEMFSLAKSINEADADRLDDRRLQEAFDAFWPKFQNAIKACGVSGAPTVAVSLSLTSSNTTGANAQDADTESDGPEARIYKADSASFQSIVSELEQSKDFGSDREFWTALIAHRRHELGISGETESVQAMHERAPASFWPSYFLTVEAMAAGNLKAANEQMRSLPPPHDARGKAHLETLQRELAGQLSDPHDASQHIKVVLSGAATDVSKSNTIESFAAKNETKGSGMVSCILREFALRLNPSDQNIRFNLAHKLADYRFSSAVAFEQYDRVRASPSPLGPNATHNMGVIASSRGIPALMYKLYEEAENKGVVLSSINLAATITALGNLREARQILEKIKDASTYRQNYDSARQRLSNAEEKLVQDEKSLKAAAKNAHTEFSRFSEMCVRSWLENHDLKTGVYSLASKGLTVRVDNQEAASMSLMRNDKVEEGILHSNGVCFEGQMSQKGTTAGPLSRSLLATPSDADGDDLLVLLWGGPLSTEPVELMTLVKER